MKQANKTWCLEKAIDIVKEYTKSGNAGDLSVILETVYKKLKELGLNAWGEK